MKHIAIALPGCHYLGPERQCETTAKRLDATLTFAASLKDTEVVYLTHDAVPYKRGGKPMSILLKESLIRRGVDPDQIHTASGFGTFSDVRAVISKGLKICPAIDTIVLVTSSWHLWVCRSLWKREARRYGIRVFFHAVPNTGGLRTHLFYGMYAIIVQLALLLHVDKYMEQILTKKQIKRLDGFQWNGCG